MRVVVWLCIVGGVIAFCVFGVRLLPSTLSVRVDPALHAPSLIADVSLANNTRYSVPGPTMLDTPLESHAEYIVDLQLSGGQHVWTRYVHMDAGDRREVDMYFSPARTADSCHLRVAANRWFFASRLVLFEGDIRADDTSRGQPKFVGDL